MRLGKRWLVLGLAFSALALQGCGGGGGSDSDSGSNSGGSASLSLSLSPNPLRVTVAVWDLPSTVTVNAVVTGSTSASTIYVVIEDENGTFSSEGVNVTKVGQNSYAAELTLPEGTAVGEHDGTLSVRLCGNAQCGSVLGSSTLPYDITVENPPVTASASPTSLTGIGITGLSGEDFSNGNVLSLRMPTLHFTSNPPYPIYVKAQDPAGRVTLPVNYYGYGEIAGPFNQETFQLAFIGPATAPTGAYSGTVTLKFCRNPDCSIELDGSLAIPYTLTYSATGDVSPLRPISGVSDWRGSNGVPTHTASVAMTVSTSSLSPRWHVTTSSQGSDGGSQNLGMLTGGNNVFLNDFVLLARSEVDGSVAWEGLRYSKAPMSSEGNLISQVSENGSGHLTLYGVNKTDGTDAFANESTTPSLGAGPVANGGKLLLQTSTQGVNRISMFDGATGAANSLPSCLQSIQQQDIGVNSSPALDSDLNAYISADQGLVVAGLGAGGACSQILADGAGNGVPMLLQGHSNVVVNTGASLVNFDVTSASVKWTAFRNNLLHDANAAINGVIYAVDVSPYVYPQLLAFSQSTGELLWSWVIPEPFEGGAPLPEMIATNNVVFVQGYRQTYAVDVDQRQAVWSVSTTGSLALSANGILYLHNVFGLTAVNAH